MGNQAIDAVLNQPPCECVAAASQQEMEASGLFAGVMRASGAAQATPAVDKKAVRLDAPLRDLSWNVTGYGNIQSMRTVSVIGFGLVGAVARNAYESGTYVPVQGRAVLTVRLHDPAAQEPLLEKTYMGMAAVSRPMSECDSFVTQSHVVSAATADAIRQLKRDLPAALTQPVAPL